MGVLESSRSRPSTGEVAAPFDGGPLAALLDLGERRRPGRGGEAIAGCQVLGRLALEQERLTRELSCTFDVGARRRPCRFRGGLGLVSHLRLSDPPLPANRKDGEAHVA